MEDNAVTRCPRCGAVQGAQTGRVTPELAAERIWTGLCPGCLLTTALTVDDGPCPYDVLAPMAEDAAGITYLAQGLRGTRSLAALKIFRPRRDVAAVLARYERWRPMLDRFVNSHSARLLDMGVTTEGRLFKATEYYAGFPLTALIDDARASSQIPAGRMPTATMRVAADVRRALARQLAGTLAAAHGAQLVHLDLAAHRVKASTSRGPHAMLLGLGSRLIVDGDAGDPARDVAGLVGILRAIGIALPDRRYDTATAVEQALAPG